MFEVNFSEIMVILVVTLVVIGPERLPQVARTIGKFWGKMQRYVNQVKQEVNKSVEMEEIRDVQNRIKAEADALERSVRQVDTDIQHEVRQLGRELESPPTPAVPANPSLPNNPP